MSEITTSNILVYSSSVYVCVSVYVDILVDDYQYNFNVNAIL